MTLVVMVSVSVAVTALLVLVGKVVALDEINNVVNLIQNNFKIAKTFVGWICFFIYTQDFL